MKTSRKTFGLLFVALFVFAATQCVGQTGKETVKPAGSANSTGSSGSSSAAGGAKAAAPATSAQSGAQPFAIETEMLAYKSLESDSEAIACDIAGFLFTPEGSREEPNGPTSGKNGKGEKPPMSRPCATVPGGTPTGIIILSSTGNTLANFQAWRADMAAMRSLQAQADKYCPAQAPGVATMGMPAPTVGDLQSMATMFATNEAASGIEGTIEDEALMDGVSRELRGMNVPVLVPDSFSPFSLGGMDFAQFPLLKSLMGLFGARARCSGSQTADRQGVVSNIDRFVNAALNPPPDSPSSNPPISGALSADGFAQAIGLNADGSFSESSVWKHVLLVKALESGGSEITQGGLILGSKVHFSGGAVATYALFTLDKIANGKLTCSGNVFDYGGYVRPKDLEKHHIVPDLDPTRQLVFLRGGCAAE
jgi:hypothetical protein